MSLVFGAICPHPPLLIPAIGRDNLKRIRKTKVAMEQLAADFYHSSAETVIIISPHGQVMAECFTINHSPVLTTDFSDFGDLDTKETFKNDLGLAYRIKESIETKIPLILTTEEKLDHGSSVPLLYLLKNKKNVLVIPLTYSLLDFSVHFSLGQAIRKIINQTNKRVAVVASGDLSHRLTKDAPAGYSKIGKEFDKKLICLLKENDVKGILNLEPNFIEEAGECGLRSILILLGVFANSNYQVNLLSYQGPFGVGYLVAGLRLK